MRASGANNFSKALAGLLNYCSLFSRGTCFDFKSGSQQSRGINLAEAQLAPVIPGFLDQSLTSNNSPPRDGFKLAPHGKLKIRHKVVSDRICAVAFLAKGRGVVVILTDDLRNGTSTPPSRLLMTQGSNQTEHSSDRRVYRDRIRSGTTSPWHRSSP